VSKARDAATARELRDRPFAGENRASVARQMIQPKGYEALLRWFIEGFRAEMPEALHAAGVWRARKPSVDADGRPREVVPGEHMGGSLLGAPRLADGFRSLLEDSPFATEIAEYESSTWKTPFTGCGAASGSSRPRGRCASPLRGR
jgi:hypothetical protein